jgi:hypothetical protein
MAVTGYSVLYDYDFGPNYLRNVGIMNIGSVDPNLQEQSYCRTKMHNLQLVLVPYTQAGFYYQIKKQNRRLEFNPLELLLIRTLMLYAVKHTV